MSPSFRSSEMNLRPSGKERKNKTPIYKCTEPTTWQRFLSNWNGQWNCLTLNSAIIITFACTYSEKYSFHNIVFEISSLEVHIRIPLRYNIACGVQFLRWKESFNEDTNRKVFVLQSWKDYITTNCLILKNRVYFGCAPWLWDQWCKE